MHGCHRTLAALALALPLLVPAAAIEARADVREGVVWPPPPDGPLLRELFDRLREVPEADRLRAFVRGSFDEDWIAEGGVDAQVEFLQTVATLSGGFDAHSLAPTEPRGHETGAWSVLARTRTERRWAEIRVGLTGDPDRRLRSLTILPARPPEDSKDPADRRGGLAADLSRLESEDRFSGVVRIDRGDETLFLGAYGWADRRWEVPVRTDTRFDLGAASMMFTATAALRLAERGEIDLDAPLDAQLDRPEEAGYGALGTRTPRQLLSHTGGLGSYLGGPFWTRSRDRYRTAADLRPLWIGRAPAFQPGLDWSFSRDGYLLLGDWLERKLDRPWETLLIREVFEPAGMKGAGAVDADRRPADVALGYTRRESAEPREATFLRPARGTPAGGLVASADDVVRFLRALAGGRLVSDETRRDAWSPVLASLPRSPYGSGFEVSGPPEARRAGHGAEFPGLSVLAEYRVDGDWTIVVLCNVDGGAAAVRPVLDRWIDAWDDGGDETP